MIYLFMRRIKKVQPGDRLDEKMMPSRLLPEIFRIIISLLENNAWQRERCSSA